MKTLGKRLRESRDKAGYKQIDAAKKLGISNGTLSGYERDYRDPDTEILHKMAELYDVTTDYLLGKSTHPTKIGKEKNDDPLTNRMFDGWDQMDEETRREALEYMEYLRQKKKKK